jgi:glycosyltransferase involved in cell wall biosynthesis
MKHPLILVVPCYNEADRLDGEAFLRALGTFPLLRIVFVNDGSRDRTGEILDDLAARSDGRARVLALASNSGKSEAVRLGLLAALEDKPGWIGYWDADLSAPLDALADFAVVMSAHRDVEIVMGSRVKLLGRDITRQASRHYAGRVFATAASLVLGVAVYDTQCGAKVFRVTERTPDLLARPFQARWIFDVELLDRYLVLTGGDRAREAERRIYELALRTWHHKPGSKLRPGDAIRAALDLWRIYRNRVT